MRALSSSLLTFVLCAVPLAAQTQNIIYHDDVNPGTGSANAFPFGAEGCRIQQLVPGSVLGANPTLIQDLFIAPAETTRMPWTESEVYYADFEIRMGITSAATLTTTWASNLPTPTTVYRGPLRVRHLRDQWVPIGLQTPFPWVPTGPNDNLVLDFIFWRVGDYGSVPPDVNGYFMWTHSSVPRTIERAYLRRWTASQPATAQAVDGNGIKVGVLLGDGNFVVHGGGCAGSSGLVPDIAAPAGTWPQLGGPLTLQLVGGPTNSAAFLNMGANNVASGGLTFPLDLGVIGATGCSLWHDVLASFPAVSTDPSGGASVMVQVPNDPVLTGARLYASWLLLDGGANPIGLTTSGFATLILGT